MTYEELIEMCKSGDPVIDVSRPDSWRVVDGDLFIDGEDSETGFCLDVRIRIEGVEGALLRVWVRDPKDAKEDLLGRTWCHEQVFKNYAGVCSWLYTW